MNNRATILLIGLFFGGLCLLWIVERGNRSARRGGDDRPLSALADVTDADVKGIELSAGTSKVRFERRGDDWQIVEPIDALADRSKLNALATTLRTLSTRPDAGDVPGPASEYGLQPPGRVLTVTTAEGSSPPVRFKIGEVRRDFVYLQLDDDPTIRVASVSGLDDLPMDADAWRARVLFPVPSHEVERVAFDRRGHPFAIAHGVGTWKIVSPFRAPADDPKVEGLVTAVIGLKVAEKNGFVAEDVTDFKPFGLDPPHLRIEVTTGQKAPITRALQIGSSVPGRHGFHYAVVGEQNDVVAIDMARIPPVETLALRLRNTEVADVNFDAATELHVEAGKLKYVLTRTVNGWAQSGPVAVDGDSRLILEYLAHIGGLHALKIIPASEARSTGLDHPAATIEVWHQTLEKPSSGPADVTLALGRFDPDQQVIHAQVKDEPNVLTLPATARKLIPQEPLAFANRTIHDFSVGSIATVTVIRDGRKVSLRSSNEPRDYEHWSMVEPVNAPVDVQAVSSLDAVLSNLRAESRLAEHDPSASGLEQPWLEVRWTLRDGKAGKLSIGDLLSNGTGARYAKSSSTAAPFTLSRTVLEILDAELHDRTVLRIPENTIESIKLISNGMTTRWRREPRPFQKSNWIREGRMTLPGPTGDMIGLLAEPLQDLRTPRFLQYRGAFEARWGLAEPSLVIEILPVPGQRPRQLRIGSSVGNRMVAATSAEAEEGAVFLLPDELVAPLLSERHLPTEVFKSP